MIIKDNVGKKDSVGRLTKTQYSENDKSVKECLNQATCYTEGTFFTCKGTLYERDHKLIIGGL